MLAIARSRSAWCGLDTFAARAKAFIRAWRLTEEDLREFDERLLFHIGMLNRWKACLLESLATAHECRIEIRGEAVFVVGLAAGVRAVHAGIPHVWNAIRFEAEEFLPWAWGATHDSFAFGFSVSVHQATVLAYSKRVRPTRPQPHPRTPGLVSGISPGPDAETPAPPHQSPASSESAPGESTGGSPSGAPEPNRPRRLREVFGGTVMADAYFQSGRLMGSGQVMGRFDLPAALLEAQNG